jgi:hypothetical protein
MEPTASSWLPDTPSLNRMGVETDRIVIVGPFSEA